MEYNGLRPTDSPLSREITTLRFLKKIIMPSFNDYSRTPDLLLHLRQYQNKMVVYAHDDLLLCRAFPFSLKRLPNTGFIRSQGVRFQGVRSEISVR